MGNVRGIREVPAHLDSQTRAFLTDLRQSVIRLVSAQAPPRAPISIGASQQPAAIQIQWTGTDADGYKVYWNDSAQLDKTRSYDAGSGQSYVDHIGQSGIQRWYWVQGYKNNGVVSPIMGPFTAMSGAVGTGVPPPIFPIPGDQLVEDLTTGFPVARGPIKKGP